MVDTRRKRACLECAKARERCTKGSPCSRCSSRALDCTYPEGKQDETTPAVVQPVRQTIEQGEPSQSSASRQSGHEASNLRTLNSLSTSADRAYDKTANPGFYHDEPHDGLRRTPITGDGIPFTTDNALAGMHSLEAVSSLPELYSPLNYLSTTPILSSPQHPSYSPAITSPLSWMSSTTEAVDIGYNSIGGLNIASAEHYTGFAPGLSNELHSPIAAISMGPYIQSHWASESEPSEASFSHGRSLSLQSNNPRSTPFTFLSPPGNMSTVPRFLGETYSPLSPWIDNFDNYYKSQYTPDTPEQLVRDNSLVTGNQEPFWIPPLGALPIGDIGAVNDCPEISDDTYTTITEKFEKLCLKTHSAYGSFLSADFPSLSHMNLFVRLYFQYFDPVLPLIHSQQLNLDDFWPLALALGAVGCQYSSRPEFSLCAGPLHEFLRRALAVELDSGNWTRHVIPLTQALVLSQVAILYGGCSQSPALARARHRTLVEIVETYGLLRLKADHNPNGAGVGNWKDWLIGETKRRLGYTIWASLQGSTGEA